jgi:hypothetical protein
MKAEYDFSNAERGKFFNKNANFNLPVYLDDEVQSYLQKHAQSKGVELASLVNDECTHIIISDGSKQMTSDNNPSIFRPDVLMRTQDILMTKNRDAEYKIAKNLQERGIIKGLAISHLKKDIEDNNHLAVLFDKVASIRTDLDSFNQIEAEATIFAGYKITTMQFKNKSVQDIFQITRSDIVSDKESEFSEYYESNQEEVDKVLDVSKSVLFKSLHNIPKNIIWIISFLLFVIFMPYKMIIFVIFVFIIFIKNKKIFLKTIINKFFDIVMIFVSTCYLKCTKGSADEL